MALKLSSLNMSLDSSYDMGLQILKSTGHIDAELRNVSLDLKFVLQSQELDNGENIPMVDITQADFTLDEKNTVIKVNGSVSAWIINLV